MTLARKDRQLLRLSTAIVLGHWDEARAVRSEAPAGEPDRAWREAVLQTHLFAGFPRLVQAYTELEPAGGLGEPSAEELEGPAPDVARGAELFDTIYGDGSTKVRALLAGHHADFERWILEHAYARVLARPGLAADRRELLAVGALAALGQDRQLASHARGALRCGATSAELAASLDAVADLIEPDRLDRARRIASRFDPASEPE